MAISAAASTNASNIEYVDSDTKKDDLLNNFLQILVAQLQHQDPLNPTEGTDFTAQLAQFYSLEESRSSNRYLKDISEGMNNDGNSAIKDPLAYVGTEVTAAIDSIYLENGNVQLKGQYTIDAPAGLTIKIYNKSGRLVRTLEQEKGAAGTYSIGWDGYGSDNKLAEDGNYSFEVITINEKGIKTTLNNTAEGIIENIVFRNNETYFTLKKDDNSVSITNMNSILIASNSKTEDEIDARKETNPTDLLGGNIKTDIGVIEYTGDVQEIFYNIEGADIIADPNYISRINIYDQNNNLIKFLERNSEDRFIWDGSDTGGNKVEQDIYTYEPTNQYGTIIKNGISGVVKGIVYKNNKAYLNVGLFNTTSTAIVNPVNIEEISIQVN